MTNTKFRKRALLSSVAMLLVALVALGSATFAWYFSNSYVTASSTTSKASTSDGLVIRKTTEATDNWGQSITYSSTVPEGGVAPMSIDYKDGAQTGEGKTTLTTTTTGMSGAQSNDVAVSTYATAGSPLADWDAIKGACVYDDFYVATTKAGGTQNVKLTINGTAIANTYINVLVFVDGTYVGSVTSTPNKADTTGRDKDGNAAGALTFTGSGNKTAAFAVSSNKTEAGASLNGSHVEVIAFPDGENPLCTSNGANQNAFTASFRFDKA